MRFLCDEMLARLGRWLRAAGYDTQAAGQGMEDGMLLAAATAEGRILITRDRELAGLARPPARAVLLDSGRLPEQARELGRLIAIDWLHAPFTRCVVDNMPLRAATAEERAGAPPKARRLGGAFRLCPACGRLYWPGSHHRRMARRLASWQSAAALPPSDGAASFQNRPSSTGDGTC